MQIRYWTILYVLVLLLSACGSADQADDLPAVTELPTPVVVRILNLDAVLTSASTPTSLPPTKVPANTSTPAFTPTLEHADPLQVTPTSGCENEVEFIQHLTIPDNTALKGGQPFTKIWQVKNTGTCSWTSDYSLRFYSGDPMDGQEILPLTQSVAPGETIDIRLNLIAPMQISTYTGYWVMVDPQNQVFGMGADGQQTLSVTIQVKPTPRPTPG